MASVRLLKKEFEFLSSQMIGDCIDFLHTFDGNEQLVMEIIDDTVKLHNGTIDRINNPDGKDNPKLVKAHFNLLKRDFIEGLNSSYAKLETLLKEKK